MPTVYDLPVDVIHRVFYFATIFAHNNLIGWRDALYLLWICQSWRGVGKHNLFKIAYIQDSVSYYFDSQGFDMEEVDLGDIAVIAHTNIHLIQQNDLLLGVEKLCISKDFNRCMDVFSIRKGLFLANNCSISCSVIKSLETAEKSLINVEDTHITDYGQVLQLSSLLAKITAKLLPNIMTLDININDADSDLEDFVSLLVRHYNQQLIGFYYIGSPVFEDCLTFTNLTTLDFNVCGSGVHRLLPVCAETLRRVNVYVEYNQFKWDMLYTDSKSDTVSFDNLESLYIKSRYVPPESNIRPHLNLANIPQKKFKFPLLKDLLILNIALRTEDIQSLFQSSLKSLRCCNYLSQALEGICRLNPSSLKSIELNVDNLIGGETSRTLIITINKICARARGVGKLSCIVSTLLTGYDFSGVFWPNLTHLELATTADFIDVIKVISRMPDLVYIHIKFYSQFSGFAKRQVEFLNNFKQYYPEPSLSALQSLHIFGFFVQLDLGPVSSVYVLNWYFPNLKEIEFQ